MKSVLGAEVSSQVFRSFLFFFVFLQTQSQKENERKESRDISFCSSLSLFDRIPLTKHSLSNTNLSFSSFCVVWVFFDFFFLDFHLTLLCVHRHFAIFNFNNCFSIDIFSFDVILFQNKKHNKKTKNNRQWVKNKNNKMKKVWECGLCLSDFNEETRCPRMLSCGHTFCTSCSKTSLWKDRQNKNNNNNQDQNQEIEFQCPRDFKMIQISRPSFDELPKITLCSSWHWPKSWLTSKKTLACQEWISWFSAKPVNQKTKMTVKEKKKRMAHQVSLFGLQHEHVLSCKESPQEPRSNEWSQGCLFCQTSRESKSAGINTTKVCQTRTRVCVLRQNDTTSSVSHVHCVKRQRHSRKQHCPSRRSYSIMPRGLGSSFYCKQGRTTNNLDANIEKLMSGLESISDCATFVGIQIVDTFDKVSVFVVCVFVVFVFVLTLIFFDCFCLWLFLSLIVFCLLLFFIVLARWSMSCKQERWISWKNWSHFKSRHKLTSCKGLKRAVKCGWTGNKFSRIFWCSKNVVETLWPHNNFWCVEKNNNRLWTFLHRTKTIFVDLTLESVLGSINKLGVFHDFDPSKFQVSGLESQVVGGSTVEFTLTSRDNNRLHNVLAAGQGGVFVAELCKQAQDNNAIPNNRHQFKNYNKNNHQFKNHNSSDKWVLLASTRSLNKFLVTGFWVLLPWQTHPRKSFHNHNCPTTQRVSSQKNDSTIPSWMWCYLSFDCKRSKSCGRNLVWWQQHQSWWERGCCFWSVLFWRRVLSLMCCVLPWALVVVFALVVEGQVLLVREMVICCWLLEVRWNWFCLFFSLDFGVKKFQNHKNKKRNKTPKSNTTKQSKFTRWRMQFEWLEKVTIFGFKVVKILPKWMDVLDSRQTESRTRQRSSLQWAKWNDFRTDFGVPRTQARVTTLSSMGSKVGGFFSLARLCVCVCGASNTHQTLIKSWPLFWSMTVAWDMTFGSKFGHFIGTRAEQFVWLGLLGRSGGDQMTKMWSQGVLCVCARWVISNHLIQVTNSSHSPHDMENDSIVLLTFGHIRSEKFLVQPITSFKSLKSDEIFLIPDKDKALITAVQETLTNARHV